MTEALIFVTGALYAASLWLIAARVAARRELALGSFPWWAIALCGIAAVAVDRVWPPQTELLAAATLIGAIVCGVVDARTGYIFDALFFTMATIASVLSVACGHAVDGLAAAAIVAAALGALHLLTGRRGLGLGDVKLASVVAGGYGVAVGLSAIGSAFVLGAAYAVALLVVGRAKRTDALRFGPFIAGGAAVVLTFPRSAWWLG